jgi:hypothetical protein
MEKMYIFFVKIINIADEKENNNTTLQLQISHAYYAANQPTAKPQLARSGRRTMDIIIWYYYYLVLLLFVIIITCH